jgi:DNA-binding MarR family transcriptional regulator
MAKEPSSTTGSLVWHLSLRWRAAVDRAVAPFGLTHAQYSVLASLRAMTRGGGTPSQRELATYTALGPIYISKLIRALENGGLVARSPDPADARAVLLSLTEHGAATVDEAIKVVRRLDRELTQALGGPQSDDVAALQASLRTLLDAADQDAG